MWSLPSVALKQSELIVSLGTACNEIQHAADFRTAALVPPI